MGLLNQKSAIGNILKTSYVHPNGFYKIPLIQFDQFGPKIRLHLWCPSKIMPSSPFCNIHSHHWDFESAVLLGFLRHRVFFEQSMFRNGMPYVKYKLCRESDDGHSLSLVGSTLLGVEREDLLEPGARYSLKAYQLHQLEPLALDRFTVTLVHQRRHTEASNHVFHPVGSTPDESSSQPRRVTQSEFSEVLDQLVSTKFRQQ